MAALVVVGVGVLAGTLVLSDGSTGNRENPGILNPLASFSDEPINVLVLGVDRQRGVQGVRADAIMIARLEPASGEVNLLSVPRDMLVGTGPGPEDRINASYARDGTVGMVRAVDDATGVRVDHRVVVSFTGFKKLVDALGGVEVNVRRDDYPDVWTLDEEGVQTLDGDHALLYARYRGGSGGDLGRIERQQQIMAALRSKLLRPQTVEDLPALATLVDENVRTDLGVGEMVGIGRAVLEQGRSPVMTHTRLEGTPETLPDGREVLVPDEEANRRIVADFLR